MIKYGLRVKDSGIILSYDISPDYDNGTVDYNLEEYVFNDNEGKQWLVNTPQHAEWVRLNNPSTYSNCYDTPKNEFKPECLEVVKIEIPEPTVTSFEITLEDAKIPFHRLMGN